MFFIDNQLSDSKQNLTILQQRILPTLTKGKDLVVETGKQYKVNFAFLMHSLLMSRQGYYPKCGLIITSSPRKVQAIATAFKMLKNRKRIHVVQLGAAVSVKKEARFIEKNPHIIIGTHERIIDHIRRDNLDLSTVEACFIDHTSDNINEGFNADVLFIAHKLPKKRLTCLFLQKIGPPTDELYEILKHPAVFHFEDWYDPEITHSYYQVKNETQFPYILTNTLLSKGTGNILVLNNLSTPGYQLAKKLKEARINAKTISSKTKPIGEIKILKELQKGKQDVIFVDTVTNTIRSMRGLSTLIYLQPPSPEEYLENFVFIEDCEDKAEIITFATEDRIAQINRIEETIGMKMKKEEKPDEEQVLSGIIQSIIKNIKEEEDPQELNRYKKIIKKNVPFFLRTYFTAYLLKYSPGKVAQKRHDYTTLFIGLGKNRKVFPRDITQLLTSIQGIQKNDIGDIKILDNYSFVDIASNQVVKAIDALNGTEYRGRKVTVNYARRKNNKNM